LGHRGILSTLLEGTRSVQMNADQYLFSILQRERVDTGPSSPALKVIDTLRPALVAWAGQNLVGLFPSGSFAKGTANHSGTDIDVFVSLSSAVNETLKDIYTKLHGRMTELGYAPKKQNVSINIKVNGYSVDLVPGKRQDSVSTDHSLYRSKADTWTKTNVAKHIQHVRTFNRINETRIIKLWRKQFGLEFPSFYLELTVIEALRGCQTNLSANVVRVLEYMRDSFVNARVVDPANTNNIISEDLTVAEKNALRLRADSCLKGNWDGVVS
jgi:hypothetical protein